MRRENSRSINFATPSPPPQTHTTHTHIHTPPTHTHTHTHTHTQTHAHTYTHTHAHTHIHTHTYTHIHTVSYPGIFLGGRGVVQQIQLRTENRQNGDLGAVAPYPLVRGSGGSFNLVQEISFHIVKFFFSFGTLRLFMMTTNLFVIANVKELRT